MVTSFFGKHSFGGDSIYVERLSRALLRKGHEVHVAYCPGAYRSVSRGSSLRYYDPPEGLVLHPLNTPGMRGAANAAWSQITGRPGPFFRHLEGLFTNNSFDVIHLHNISLMGAESVVGLAAESSNKATLITMHDYWWICPQSLFWKFGRQECDSPDCIKCNIRRGVPPQLWRDGRRMKESLSYLDAVLYPSRSAAEIYMREGFDHPGTQMLPGVLPRDWRHDGRMEGEFPSPPPGRRPYIAAAGRLVVEKGFQTLIPLMKLFPELDLMLAGDGPLRGKLEKLAAGSDNVQFLGLLPSQGVKNLFSGARAVVIPSLFPETFGLVAAEAAALGVQVIARGAGALPELINSAGAGTLYHDQDELEACLEAVRSEADSCSENSSRQDPPEVWFEEGHLKRYLSIIDDAGMARKQG